MRERQPWIQFEPGELGAAGLRALLEAELSLQYASRRREAAVHLTALASPLVAVEAWWPGLLTGAWRSYFLGGWEALALLSVYFVGDEVLARRRRNQLRAASPDRTDDGPRV